MALLSRISHLFTADFHALLDCLEEPESVCRQAIRDMEEELSDLERQIEIDELEIARVNRRISDARAQTDQITVELDVCFQSSEDELAKSLIRRKLIVEKQIDAFTQRSADLTALASSRKEALAENQRHLAAMQEKLQIFTGLTDDLPDDSARSSMSCADNVSEDEVEIAFLRAKQSRESALGDQQ